MNIKTNFKLSLVLLSVFALISCNKKEDDRIFSKGHIAPIKKARKELGYYLTRNSTPGSSISVSIDGELIWSEGIGLASTDLEVPASRDTKYRIGEITQVITALTYNVLVENGELQPDSSILFYLPGFPDIFKQITLKQLINHSSGIRKETASELNRTEFNGSIEKGLEAFKNDTLLFKPGKFQFQSMFNYNLIGAVIENATNKRFNKVVSETLGDTLNLKNLVPDNALKTIRHRSEFYATNYVTRVINALPIDLRYSLSSNGYLSTADDLNKIGNAFLYSDYISDKIRNKTFTPSKIESNLSLEWANGWFLISKKTGGKFYGCRGQIRGGAAALLIYPDEKMVIAMTSNLSDELEELPIFKIAQEFLDFISPNKKLDNIKKSDN